MIRPSRQIVSLGEATPAPTPGPVSGMKYLAYGLGALFLYLAWKGTR